MTNPSHTAIQWHKLLGRVPAPVEASKWKHMEGATILITGAGGSIGSALTKAMLDCAARQVVLLDSSEQALYRLTSELASCHRAVPILGNVLDEALLDEVFSRFRPAFVFHTAAFKHLPLLERQPFAAIENNTIGTYLVVQAAEKFRAGRLIAISTDKAVNPTSIMGASKRLAELLVASFTASSTRMTTVRLANVIGSDGSVAPRFVEQIERGASVTVSDPEATRYFFTIEETVNIILSASQLETKNAIVIPPQVQTTSILSLAEFLVHELESDEAHLRLERSGLRPGEKFHEELAYDFELHNAKKLGGLRVIPTQPSPLDVEQMIADLRLALRERDVDRLTQTVRRYVPEYRPSTQLQQLSAARTRA